MAKPLFVCWANCCRSVLAKYLYEQLSPRAEAFSAGIEMGDEINDRALAMLRTWGIDAGAHRPRRLTRTLCDRADAIFIMGPEYLRALLAEHGADLAAKCYLFADPFTLPPSLKDQEYLVYDPSFDERSVAELVREFEWFQRRVAIIYEALEKGEPALVASARYLEVLAGNPRQ